MHAGRSDGLLGKQRIRVVTGLRGKPVREHQHRRINEHPGRHELRERWIALDPELGWFHRGRGELGLWRRDHLGVVGW
jgi:hypothetical protein